MWPDVATWLLISAFMLLFTGGCLGFLWRVIPPESSLFGNALQRDVVGKNICITLGLLGSLLIVLVAIGTWLSGSSVDRYFGIFLVQGLPAPFPQVEVGFTIDRFSAFFLALTALVTCGIFLYSYNWLDRLIERWHGNAKGRPYAGTKISGMLDLVLLCTIAVLTANNVVLWLISIECLTLTLAGLTLYRHDELRDGVDPQAAPDDFERAKRAFKVLLIFSHVALLLISACMIALATHAASTPESTPHALGFAGLRSMSDFSKDSVLATVIFSLALAGFGLKAALTPAHAWLPLAHPYLPTNVHALMSSVVIKVTGIYGLVRVLFEFINPASSSWWWGLIILAIAAVTAVTTVSYAIASRDLKTALANHSIENMGIIVAGIGIAVICRSLGATSSVDTHLASSLAGLALTASLYHLVNHSLFKSLLFLGTGAIEYLTGTVKLDMLGGLVNRFRWTSATFVVGCLAIAGLPPLNGFISEWLTIQAGISTLRLLVLNSTGEQLILGIGLLLSLLLLFVAFGLTALAFVKICGEVVLGRSRSAEVSRKLEAEKRDVPRLMKAVLVSLAAICALIGILPAVLLSELVLIPSDFKIAPSTGTNQDTGPGVLVQTWPSHLDTVQIETQGYSAGIATLPLLLPIALILLVCAVLLLRRPYLRRGDLWTGSANYDPTRMQITGGAFAFAVLDWIRWRPSEARRRRRSAAVQGSSSPQDGREVLPWRLAISANRFAQEFSLRVLNYLLTRLLLLSEAFGDALQNGDVRRYLRYLFLAIVLVLIIMLFALSPRQ